MHIFLVFSFFLCTFAPLNGENCCCSSVVEHFLGKEEVTSSSLVNSSEKEEPRLFLFCIRTSSNPPPPKPSLFEQKCRIAGVSPRGRLKRIEHFASSEYSVQSNPVHFNSSSCIRFRRQAAQSQNGLRAHYKQVRITLYIFTGNFDFKSKSKQSTKLLFQYKISRFSRILSLHFPPFRTLYGFSKLLHKCVILTTNRNNLHQKPGKPLQKSKYYQANRYFLISMLNPEHLTNFKNLKA